MASRRRKKISGLVFVAAGAMFGLVLVAAVVVLLRGKLLTSQEPGPMEDAEAARAALVRGDLEAALEKSADVLGNESAAPEAKKVALDISSTAGQLLDVRKLWQTEKRYATALGLLNQLAEKQSEALAPGQAPSRQPPLDLSTVIEAEKRAVTAEQEARAEELLRQATKTMADGDLKSAMAALRDATAFELGGPSPARKERVAQLLDQGLEAQNRKGLDAASGGRLKDAIAQIDRLLSLVHDSQDLFREPARWQKSLDAEKKQIGVEQSLLSRAETILASGDVAAARQLLAQPPEVRYAKDSWTQLVTRLQALRPPTPTPKPTPASLAAAASTRSAPDTVFEPPPMEALELDQIAQTAFEVEGGSKGSPPAEATPAVRPSSGAAPQQAPLASAGQTDAVGQAVAALAAEGPAARPAGGQASASSELSPEAPPAAGRAEAPVAKPAARPTEIPAQPDSARSTVAPAAPAVVEPPAPQPSPAAAGRAPSPMPTSRTALEAQIRTAPLPSGPRPVAEPVWPAPDAGSRTERLASPAVPKSEAPAPGAASSPGARSSSPRSETGRPSKPGRIVAAEAAPPPSSGRIVQTSPRSASTPAAKDAALLKQQREQAEAGRQYFLKGRQLETQAETRKDDSYYRIAVEAYTKVPEDAERLVYVQANARAGRILSYRLRDYAQAVPHFEQAIRKDPRHPILHYEVGYAAFHLGRFDEAIKAFSRVGIYAGINPDEVKDYPKLELQMFYLNALSYEAKAGRSEGDPLLLRDSISAWQSYIDSCRMAAKLCDEKHRKQAESHLGRLRDWLKKSVASRMGESSE
jgi:tetratricopeptide (TPR) repeat protein